MAQRDVQITAADGTARASLHIPDGHGPWPAVVVFPDAFGLRDVMRGIGDGLAAAGFVALVPDVYYRHGDWAPLDPATAFGDEAERSRLMSMMTSLTPERGAADAQAYIDYLLALPEVSGTAVGTTGYCMGGRLSLNVAARLGDRVAAAASFHGGNIAAENDPGSPHLIADGIKAKVYVAGAIEDASFSDEQKERLDRALTEAGVDHTIETYPARHGFAVPDNGTYDESAAQRHWTAMTEFFAAHLR